MNIGIFMFVAGIIGMSVSLALIIWSYSSKTVNMQKTKEKAVNNTKSIKNSNKNLIAIKKDTKKDDTMMINTINKDIESKISDDTFVLGGDDTCIINNELDTRIL